MRYFTAQTSNPLNYSVCGNLISRNGFLHDRRILDIDVLILVLEGTLWITQAERAFAVGRDQFILLKSGEEHYGHRPSEGPLSYLWVHFAPSGGWHVCTEADLPRSGEDSSYFLPESGTLRSPQHTRRLFFQLLDLSRRETHYPQEMYRYAVSLLLMELSQDCLGGLRGGAGAQPSPLICEVVEWVQAHCHQHISTREIAAVFHYNAEYLSTLFKKETGMTLTYYLNLTRIELSKRLLTENSVSVKEAAYSCGFPDEKYYMKTFKKYTGMTPLQYRNAYSFPSLRLK